MTISTQTPAAGLTPRPAAGTNWKLLGVCASVDPDLWFPEPGSSSAAAKRVCLGCEVRFVCLEYALEHGERGIWGATTENQRRAIRRARDLRPTRPHTGGKPPAACGSRAAYERHVRHGEDIDDDCQAAYDAYLEAKAARKREQYAEHRDAA